MTTRTIKDTLWYRVAAGIGCLVITLLGSGWSAIALVFNQRVRTIGLIVLVVLTLALLGFIGQKMMTLLQHKTQFQSNPADEAQNSMIGRSIGIRFGIIFALEIVIIMIAAPLLANAGYANWIPLVVILVVGLHFLPLAHVFQISTYTMTGIAMVVVALLSLFIASQDTRLFLSSLSVTLILWLTAIIVSHTYVRPILPHGK